MGHHLQNIGMASLWLLLLAPASSTCHGEELVAEDFSGSSGLSWVHIGEATVAKSDGDTPGITVSTARGGGGVAVQGVMDGSEWGHVLFDLWNPGQEFLANFRAVDADGIEYASWYQRVPTGPARLEYSLRGFASAVPQRGVITSLDISRIATMRIAVAGRPNRPLPQPISFDVRGMRFVRGEIRDPLPVMPIAQGKPVPTNPDNLLWNPDFELGLQFWDSWLEWDKGVYVLGDFARPDAYNGAASAAIICKTPGRGGIFTTVEVPHTGPYRLRFAVKGDAGQPMRVAISAREPAPSHTENIPLDGSWQIIERNWELAAGKAMVYLMHVGSGTLLIDEVSLEPLNPQTQAESSVTDDNASTVRLDADRIRVNGKLMFPIGIYGVADPKADLADSGFNLAIGSATGATNDAWFQACADAGVMTLAGMTGMMRAHLAARAGDIPPLVRNHSALLGYYLCDEPDHDRWNVTPSEIRTASRILRQIDPDHPTIVLVMSWQRAACYQYANTADILASDPYALAEDMDKPLRSTRWKDDALADPQPIWTVLQAGWDRTPIPDAMVLECQAYTALASGADGLLWFERGWCRKHPQIWERLCLLTRELASLGDRLCGLELPEHRPQSSDARIIGIAKRSDADGKILLITVNTTLDDVGSVSLSVPGLPIGSIREVFDDTPVDLKDGIIHTSFGPGVRRVYLLD